MVGTVCYGVKTIWDRREDAMNFFLMGIMSSEGSERERYMNIYCQLESGADIAVDEEDCYV